MTEPAKTSKETIAIIVMMLGWLFTAPIVFVLLLNSGLQQEMAAAAIVVLLIFYAFICRRILRHLPKDEKD